MVEAGRGRPELDESSASRHAKGSLLPVVVVLGFGIGLIVLLIGFTGLAGLYIVLALAGVLSFAGLHYVLWGWWLTNKIRADEEAEGRQRDA